MESLEEINAKIKRMPESERAKGWAKKNLERVKKNQDAWNKKNRRGYEKNRKPKHIKTMGRIRKVHTINCNLYPLRGVARAKKLARINILKSRFANQKIENVFIANVQVKTSFSGDSPDELMFTVLAQEGQKIDLKTLNLKLLTIVEALLKRMK